MLAVEQVVAVGNDSSHLDGVDEMHFLPGLLFILRDDVTVQAEVGIIVVERVDAHVDSVGTAHGAEGEIAALVAAHVHGVAQTVASVACP